MTLPTDAQERKDTPIFSGVLRYFPRAIAYVAMVSKAGNDQHHPGTPLHWDKSKSTDEGDALVRHQMEAGMFDSDGIRHSGKVAWRGLAQLQRELDAEQALDQRRTTSLEEAVKPRTLSRLDLADAFYRAGVSQPIAAADTYAALDSIAQKTLEDGYEELQKQKAEEDRGEDWTWLP